MLAAPGDAAHGDVLSTIERIRPRMALLVRNCASNTTVAGRERKGRCFAAHQAAHQPPALAKLPSRNAEAMASGTSASARTTSALFSATLAFISCSRAMATGATLFGLGPGHAGVGLGLVGLQPGADVLADVDIGDVDRHDLKRRLRVETAFEHGLGNHVRVFHHDQMAFREPIEVMMPSPTRAMIVSSVAPPINCLQVGAHGHAGADLQLDAVFGDRAQRRLLRLLRVGAVDHFGVDARPHRFQHVATGQVDGRRAVEVEIDVGPVRRDDRLNHVPARCRRPGNGPRAGAW